MIGAVDIGGTKIAVAVVEESGRIVARTKRPTGSESPELAVLGIAAWLRSSPLRGIGVGCTGPVDPLAGTVGHVDLLPGWAGFELAHRLSDETGVAVVIENDADAAALAEAKWGAGKCSSRFIYVTIGTGIGPGMVFDGRLYRGVGGSHPEAGHQTIDPSGPPCYCGSSGCWESWASGPAIAQWFKSNAGDRPFAGNLTARDIFDLTRQGDILAVQAVQREGEYLGIGLANLVTMFCPDVIALGGGVMRSADLFLDLVLATVRSRCGLVPVNELTITRAALGNDAALLGAARVWQARFGESE